MRRLDTAIRRLLRRGEGGALRRSRLNIERLEARILLSAVTTDSELSPPVFDAQDPDEMPLSDIVGSLLLADDGYLSATLSCGNVEFIPVTEQEEVVVIEGFSLGGDSGNPQLPTAIIQFGLPPSADLSTVTLEVQQADTVYLPGVHQIVAAPPAALSLEGELVLNWGEGKIIEDGKNVLVYGQDDFYGKDVVRLLGAEQMRKWKFAAIEYTPIQYNPVSGEVRWVTDVQIQLTFNTDDPLDDALMADAAADAQAEGMLVNYDTLLPLYTLADQQGEPSELPSADTADYVIITTAAIQSGSLQLANFVAHKQTRGYSVQLITEGTWGGGTGDTAAENIRSWLAANYASMGTDYVLLVGDPNPTSGDVPMKMASPRNNATTDTDHKESPTDYYYADLTSNWDSDSDGYFGEWGDDFSAQPVHEVLVGRIPVYGSSYSELDSIITKIINYETETNIDWRDNVLLPMAISNYANENGGGASRCDGHSLAEYVRDDIATPQGYGTYHLYETAGLDPVTASCDAPITQANVVGEWSSNPYGVTLWWGHGNAIGAYRKYWSSDDGDGVPESWEMTKPSFFSSSDASSLDDAHPSVVVQVSCENGYPENSSNLGYTLLTNGAISTYSATRVSWYAATDWYPDIGLIVGDNASYAYYIAERMIENETTESSGAALQWCRENFSMGWSDGASWMNALGFNLYGDPTIMLGATGAGDVVLFSDDFPSTTINTANWTTVADATIDDVGIAEPSPLYSLHLNGFPNGFPNEGDRVESRVIDLSSVTSATLSYYYERTGNGNSPETGDDLFVEYWNGSTWPLLESQPGSGDDMSSYVQSSISLPAGALHSGFRFRFRSKGTGSSSMIYDDWFVDDVQLTATPATDTTPPTVTNRDPAPGSTITTSTVDIDVTFSEAVQDVDLSDLVLTGAAAAGASVAAPTGGGDTWLFPVSGLVSGALNVSLAPDADDIEDLAGNDLANLTWDYTVSLGGPTTLFFDDFPSTTINTANWWVAAGATIDDVGIAEPSAPYSVRLTGYPDASIMSVWIDLSSVTSATLSYYYEQTGNGDSPDAGDDLVTEYWHDSSWVELERQLGSGPDMTSYVQSSISLPAGALGGPFRFRFVSSGYFADWFVDDVQLTATPVTDTTPPTVTNRDPAPGSTITTSTVDIDVTFSEAVQDVDLSDLVLTGAAAAGASVAAATGGGDTWLFPVSGLVSGALNVSLAPDADDIEDLAGNDLANLTWDYTVSLGGPTTLFFDDFPDTTIDAANWTTVADATIDEDGIAEPSAPYSLRLDGYPNGGDRVESRVIDLSSVTSATLSYYYERTGDGESPDLNDDLVTEYWNGSTWVLLESQLGSGDDMTSYVQSSISLPAGALHSGFRFSFERAPGTTGYWDDWFVDDVVVFGSGAAVTADIVDIAPDPRNTVVTDAAIVFSEAVTGFDISDLSLTRGGGADLLEGDEPLTTSDDITWVLSNLEALTGTEGTYVLLLTASGSGIEGTGGNPFDDDASDLWVTDTTAPGADVVDVSPDPRNTAVSQVTINFTEAVTGVDVSDLRLSRDGGTNLLTGTETVSTTDNVQWTLEDLADLTGTEGSYTLTLTAAGSGITDEATNPLASDASDAWLTDTTGPTADVIDVTPDPRTTAVDQISIAFDEEIVGFDLDDLTLTRDGSSNLLIGTETLSSGDNINWILSVLTAITGNIGNYTFTLTASGSGIQDTAGNPLSSDAADTWTVRPEKPDLDEEPSFTAGLTNTLSWAAVSGANEYYAEMDDDPNFGSPDDDSDWISDLSYEFTGLADGQTYYYRVKARTIIPGATDSWEQTSQAHFETDTLTDVSTSTSPDDVVLAGAGTTHFADNFEDGDYSGWTDGTDPAVREVTDATAAGGTYSFTINGGDGEHKEGVYHALSSIQPDTIQFSVRSSDTTKADGYFVAGSTESISDCVIFFYMKPDGQMGLYAAGSDYLTPYVANQWYNIRLELDWTTEQVDYYVDGSPVAIDIPFRESESYLGRVDLYNFHDSQAWWDEIAFTSGGGGDYVSSGDVVSTPITPSALEGWNTVAFNSTTPAGTDLTVDVLPASGSTPITGFDDVPSGTDLSAITESTIRLRANLSTSDPAETPFLHDWTVAYQETADTYVESAWSDAESSTQDDTAPTILSWHSAKDHESGVGEAVLEIPDDGNFSESRAGIEAWNRGISRLLITFDEAIDPATFTPSSVLMAGNDENGEPVVLSGVSVTTSTRDGDIVGVIEFSPALPDYARYLVQVEGVTDPAGNALTGDNDRIMTGLIGDAYNDNDGSNDLLVVDNVDMAWVRYYRDLPANPIDPGERGQVRADIWPDGVVDNIDMAWVRWARDEGHDASGIPDPVLPPAPESVGSQAAEYPFHEGWESGDFAGYWEVIPGAEGRIEVTRGHGRYEGRYHVIMDDTVKGSAYSLNQLILHIDLSGQSNVELSFAGREWRDEDHAEDVAEISVDGGATWHTITPLTGLDNRYQEYSYDLDVLGLTYSSHTLIRFQQYDDDSVPRDGLGLDNIRVGPGQSAGPASVVQNAFREDVDHQPPDPVFPDRRLSAPGSMPGSHTGVRLGALRAVPVLAGLNNASINVEDLWGSLRIGGDLFSGSVDAGALGRVLVMGEMGEEETDEDTDEIHANRDLTGMPILSIIPRWRVQPQDSGTAQVEAHE